MANDDNGSAPDVFHIDGSECPYDEIRVTSTSSGVILQSCDYLGVVTHSIRTEQARDIADALLAALAKEKNDGTE